MGCHLIQSNPRDTAGSSIFVGYRQCLRGDVSAHAGQASVSDDNVKLNVESLSGHLAFDTIRQPYVALSSAKRNPSCFFTFRPWNASHPVFIQPVVSSNTGTLTDRQSRAIVEATGRSAMAVESSVSYRHPI